MRARRTKSEANSYYHALNLLTHPSIHRYWVHYRGLYKLRIGNDDDTALLTLVKDLETEGSGRCDDPELAKRAADLLLFRSDEISVPQTTPTLHASYPASLTALSVTYSPSSPEQTNLSVYGSADVHLPVPAASRSSSFAYSQARPLNDPSNRIHIHRSYSNDPSHIAARSTSATQSSNHCAIQPSIEASTLRRSYSAAENSILGSSTSLPWRRPAHHLAHQYPFTTPSTSYDSRSQNAPIAGHLTSRFSRSFISEAREPSLGASCRPVYRPSTAGSVTTDTSCHQDGITPGSSASSIGGGHAYTCPSNIGVPAPPAYSPPGPVFEASSDAYNRMTRTLSSDNPSPGHTQRRELPTSPNVSLSLDRNTLNELATATEAGDPTAHNDNYRINTFLQEDRISVWTHVHPGFKEDLGTQLDNSIIEPLGSDYSSHTVDRAQGFDDHYPGVD